MVRGVLVVLALTAAAARAQENPEGARSPGATGATAPPEDGAGRVVLASRSPTPKRDAGTGAPDGGVGGGATVKAIEDPTAAQVADCSVSAALLSGQAPAIRYYTPPAQSSDDQRNEWDQAPYVRAVVRCGQRFHLQVYSQSASSWIMDHARVEGPQGEILRVVKPDYRQQIDGWDINLVAVEIPPGTKLSMLKLHMVGKDGRVAQTTVEDLP